MSKASQLLDSRRFCLVMDELATVWKKRSSTDEDREFKLGQLLDLLDVQDEPVTASQAIAQEQARRKANRAPEAGDEVAMTAAEAAQLRAEAKPVTEEELQGAVDLAVAEAIKPHWKTAPMDSLRAAKRFTVKAVRNGTQLSMQIDRWEAALAKAGLPKTVSFSYAGLGPDAGGSGDPLHHIVYIG